MLAHSIQDFQLKADAFEVIMNKWETVAQMIFNEWRGFLNHPELMDYALNL